EQAKKYNSSPKYPYLCPAYTCTTSLHAAIRSTSVVAPSIGNRCLSSRLSTVPPTVCGCDSAIILACSKLSALQYYRIRTLSWNRMRTALFGVYRLDIENGKIIANPVKLLKRRKVSSGRVRFLKQFEPLETNVDYLKPLKTEAQRLRAVIERDYPEHLDEFEIALHAGMRRSEQYQRID